MKVNRRVSNKSETRFQSESIGKGTFDKEQSRARTELEQRKYSMLLMHLRHNNLKPAASSLQSKLEANELDLEALLSVPGIVDFDVSGNEKLIFVSNKTGQFQLYHGTISQDGVVEYVQLTEDEESKAGPRFSPDSSRVLYASDHHGDEKFNLFLYDFEKKSTTQLTNCDTTIYPNAYFSKDGKRAAYISNHQKQFATYILNLETNHTSRISYHPFPDEYATISPDSKLVAITGHIGAQEEGVFVTSLGNPSSGEIKIEENQNQIDASQPTWSPDSSKLAFVSASKGMFDIGVFSLENRGITWLTRSDHEYGEPTFSNDGKKLAFTQNSGGDVKLVVHDFQINENRTLDFRHGIASSPKFFSDDRSIVFLFEGPRNPYDLWQYRFADDKFVQLTTSLPDGIDVSNFVDGEQISYKSKDQLNIPALLYMPNKSALVNRKKNAPKRARANASRENLPAVIEIHGGPSAQALNSWSPFIQALVSKGFLVLRPNYRGSTGFGRKFREANRFVMGDLDLADCAGARDFLVQRRLADPKKIGVTGGSFGGYLTMCCLAKYPDLWSCGAALVPFLNWFTEIQNEREELRFWDLQNMGDPEKDKERLKAASPIFFLDGVKSPVLLVAGANDPRCPIEESVQAKDELEKYGRDFELLVYGDEGHGFRKTKNKVDAYSKTIAFLEKNILRKIAS